MNRSIRGISDEIFKQAKAKAALLGMTIGELITKALLEYIKKH